MSSPFSLNADNTLLVVHHIGSLYSTYAIADGFISRKTHRAPLPGGVDLGTFDEVAMEDVKVFLEPHLTPAAVSWVEKLVQAVQFGSRADNYVVKSAVDLQSLITR